MSTAPESEAGTNGECGRLSREDDRSIANCSEVTARDVLADYRFDPARPFDEAISELQSLLAMSDRTYSNLGRALDMIDPQEREALIARHGDRFVDFDPVGPVKYADFPYWALRNLLIAEWLGLDDSPPLEILDVGMGSGSFAMVAQSLGHRVTGTDIADPWYEELCALAGVRRIVAPVVRGKSYRPAKGPFDLVTAMLPAFHRASTGDGGRVYWSVEDWARWLDGIFSDLIAADGKLFILMPLDKLGASLCYSPLVQWAKERGAILDRTLPGAPVRHILFHRRPDASTRY